MFGVCQKVSHYSIILRLLCRSSADKQPGLWRKINFWKATEESCSCGKFGKYSFTFLLFISFGKSPLVIYWKVICLFYVSSHTNSSKTMRRRMNAEKQREAEKLGKKFMRTFCLSYTVNLSLVCGYISLPYHKNNHTMLQFKFYTIL